MKMLILFAVNLRYLGSNISLTSRTFPSAGERTCFEDSSVLINSRSRSGSRKKLKVNTERIKKIRVRE
jgi:hypothetical protein